MTIKACRNCGKRTQRSYCPDCEFMTQEQAWTRLQVSRSTYFRMVLAGTIKPRRIGLRKLLVLRAEVDAILRA
jgi:excisionase family DNA binding protein